MKKTIRITILTMLCILLILPTGSVSFGDAVLIGDVDGDGEVTAKDANQINRYLAKFENLDFAQRSRADFDGDGMITAYDATLILSALVSPEVFPKTLWNFNMIVTSDQNGEAWGSVSADETGCSALNLVSYVNREREKDPDVFLVDAGGSLFGSAISDDYNAFTSKKISPMTLIFQSLQYDAVILGSEAAAYPSQTIRNEMDALVREKIPVVGSNITKTYPDSTDPKIPMWNDILSYCILESRQSEDQTLRIGLIGIVEPDLCDAEHEVQLYDPAEAFENAKAELAGKCDFCMLFYNGNIENDESQSDIYSLRGFLRRISGVDVALVSHGSADSIRVGRDARGNDVPIISLPDGVETAMKLSLSRRDNGALIYRANPVDLRSFEPDEALQEQIKPYVTAVSQMMDARVGTLTERIEPFAADALGMTDGMELVHEMQIWGSKQWMQEQGLDLPSNVISIAYPYLGTDGWDAGAVRYRDLCARTMTKPQYTLMLIRGSELRAWLSAYTERVTSEETVYSLYGLSYLLNTINPETPLGYLEYSSGLAVEGEEVFTLILAEEPDSEKLLQPYLDESWMPYEDRVISGFSMPVPYYTSTSEAYRNADLPVAFFETIGEFSLKRETSWFVI